VKEKSGDPAQPSLAASFSTTFSRGEARWTPHPLKDRGDDDRYAVPATDLEGPVDRTNLRGRRLLFWVKRRNTRGEQMFSAVLPTADNRHCMSKEYLFTLKIRAMGLVAARERPRRHH
jgi:hypothetical protein